MKELVICAIFVALMAVGANISPFLTIGGVPITLQLLFAILAGGLLGSRLGTIAMTSYLIIGLAGVPVFAQMKGGLASILSPTFGFVISFILVAFITGRLAHKPKNKRSVLYAGMSALFFNYVIGTHYMYFALTTWANAPNGFSYRVAWSWMLAYLPIDLAVIILSFVLLPKIRQALQHRHVILKEE